MPEEPDPRLIKGHPRSRRRESRAPAPEKHVRQLSTRLANLKRAATTDAKPKAARVHGRFNFGQISEHYMNKLAFGVYPPRDDDLNRQLSLQKSVAFDVSMATELCDRQLVDSAHHPSVTLKRSFVQQRILVS